VVSHSVRDGRWFRAEPDVHWNRCTSSLGIHSPLGTRSTGTVQSFEGAAVGSRSARQDTREKAVGDAPWRHGTGAGGDLIELTNKTLEPAVPIG